MNASYPSMALAPLEALSLQAGRGRALGYLPTGDRLRFAAGKLVVSHGLGVIKGIVRVSLNSP